MSAKRAGLPTGSPQLHLHLITRAAPRKGPHWRLRPRPEPDRTPWIVATLIDSGIALTRLRSGAWFGPCPKCDLDLAVSVDADGGAWRSSCACYPRGPLDERQAWLEWHRAAHAEPRT